MNFNITKNYTIKKRFIKSGYIYSIRLISKLKSIAIGTVLVISIRVYRNDQDNARKSLLALNHFDITSMEEGTKCNGVHITRNRATMVMVTTYKTQ